ncbi:hypothetical protein ACFPN0_15160 [Kitasatospora cinereorecta]
MSANADQVQFTAYGPERFAEHLPFARRGHLFTVPGDFPEDTPANTNVIDWQMAVYRSQGEWEVRDVDGNRKVWGTGPSRRVAVGLAFLEIARVRRARAADIADRRVNVLGLEAVPPYTVEVTDGVTLVLTPQAIAHLVRIEATDFGHPANYHVTGPNGGGAYVIRAEKNVELRTLEVGVLHIRCGCDPDGHRFDNETDALDYVREELAVWEVCPKSPGAPAAEDQQPEDDEVAGMAVIARTVRRAYSDATELLVRAEDYTVTSVLADGSAVWTEHESELPDGMHFELVTYLADLLAGTEAPAGLGWRESTEPGVFTVSLPPVAP